MSVYLPTGPTNVNTDWLKSQELRKDSWIIGGDFNAHSLLWEDDCTTTTNNRLVDNILDSDLTLLNDGSITRLPDNVQHRATAIDLTLISPKIAVDITWNVLSDPLGSDHLAISISLDNSKSKSENVTDKIPKYKYDQADWYSFQNYLSSIDCDRLQLIDDINELFSEFRNAILNAADKTIPKSKNFVTGKHVGNIWWNPDCAKAVSLKKRKI